MGMMLSLGRRGGRRDASALLIVVLVRVLRQGDLGVMSSRPEPRLPAEVERLALLLAVDPVAPAPVSAARGPVGGGRVAAVPGACRGREVGGATSVHHRRYTIHADTQSFVIRQTHMLADGNDNTYDSRGPPFSDVFHFPVAFVPQ